MTLMLPIGPGRELLFGLPLFHVGGTLTQCLAPLFAGGTLVVLSRGAAGATHVDPHVWRLVERYRPELVAGVPTVDRRRDERAGRRGRRLERAHRVGRRLGDTGRRRQDLHGAAAGPVLEVYGMTEASSVHRELPRSRSCAVGSVGLTRCPTAGCAWCAVLEGRLLGDCAADEIGVVAMRGPGVFAGLPQRRVAQPGAFVEPGWAELGRPRPARRRRLSLDHRPGQGPGDPRRPQHRPARDRGSLLHASGGGAGRRRRPTRRLRRRAAGLPSSSSRRPRSSAPRSSSPSSPNERGERPRVPVAVYLSTRFR